MSKATSINQLRAIVKKLEQSVVDAISTQAMRSIGEYSVDLVRKRTLLGYGVDDNYSDKRPLKKLSPKYIKARTMFEGLSDKTTPKKSNLTRTGQMLASLSLVGVSRGSFGMSPTGTRDDGYTNKQIAQFQEKQGRVFNRVSRLEFNQILRQYRREFGDLLTRRGLIR